MAPERVLGRGDELARIERFITDFPQGSHALVIAGEAGIGKTVLWAEAERLARSRDDLTVLVARATESEASLAYVVLTDLLESIASAALPILPRPQAEALAAALLLDRSADPAMRDPRTIGTAVLGTLRLAAADRPVLLAIDDAQWVDPASAAALEFALRRSLDDPNCLNATNRTSESGYRDAYVYTAENIDRMRAHVGDPNLPCHALGGIGDATYPEDVAGMYQAAAERGCLGGSLYDYRTTTDETWTALQQFRA